MIFSFMVENVKYHEVMSDLTVTFDYSNSFFVRQGTPGIYLSSIAFDDYHWSLVLFPEGIGWVDSYCLRLVK